MVFVCAVEPYLPEPFCPKPPQAAMRQQSVLQAPPPPLPPPPGHHGAATLPIGSMHWTTQRAMRPPALGYMDNSRPPPMMPRLPPQFDAGYGSDVMIPAGGQSANLIVVSTRREDQHGEGWFDFPHALG